MNRRIRRALRWLGASRPRAVAATVVLVLLAIAVPIGVWVALGDGDSSNGADTAAGDGAAAGDTTTSSMATGGIEVEVPAGWRAVPLPRLGFGVAIPFEWEAVVLTDDALSDLADASPVVPGFLEAAHAAQQTGAVLYAAGVDDQGRVTDLTVRAEPGTGITDVAGLEAYAGQLASEAGVTDPAVQVVEGTERPTVDVRYQLRAQRPAEQEGAASREVTVQGTERVVLGPGPRNVVYSLVVTSDDVPDHDTVAGELLGSLTFGPTAPG